MKVPKANIKPDIPLKQKAAVNKASVLVLLCSFFVTAFIILLSFVFLGFAPFGNSALIYKDGQHQLLDLFCWYKDVLSGRSSIDYSFTKYLGGSNYAVFSYYLSSPLSLLVVFFDKTQIPLFMNIIYLLKVSFASLFAGYYLLRRFKPKSRTGYAVTLILAISYGLSLYMISQTSTTMWLDGVYMLPLMLAGIEKLVDDKKSTLFIVSTALALCFNWYTGIMNLIFAGIWFLFECCRFELNRKEKMKLIRPFHPGMRHFFGSVFRFATACVIAGLISAVILIPTLSLLAGRSFGKSGLGMLLDFSFIGPVHTVISNYSFGIVSVKGSVNLFAGSLVFIGTVLLFLSSSKKIKEKLLYGALLLTVILSFYWQPLVALFSMLRTVDSLWYRYSYVGSFALIYLASVFYLESDLTKTKLYMPPCIAVVYSVIVFFATDRKNPTTAEILMGNKLSELFGTPQSSYLAPMLAKMVFPVVTALILCIALNLRRGSQKSFRPCAALLSIILVVELLFNQMVLMKIYYSNDGPKINSYTSQELQLLSTIDDPSFYRVVQTTYHSYHHGLAASYCEPMAYGFNSVTTFVSAPDENTVAFLDRAGYPGYYYTIPVTSSENLALDSLLSVKYVLLPEGDTNNAGLEKIDGIEGFKDLYLNPYAAPAAFVIDKTGDYDSKASDPALYLNDMYRYLSGVEKDIFIPVYTVIESGTSTDDGYVIEYRFNTGEDFTGVVYANFETGSGDGCSLYMNGEFYTKVSTDMAPTMVRIEPVDGTIDLELILSDAKKAPDVDFYYLDTEALAEATSAMTDRSVSQGGISDGHCVFEINGAKYGESLFTSIPYHKGWTITRNGKKIGCDLTGDTFITIPLDDGNNVIEMTYQVPNKSTGIAATVIGILLLAGQAALENRKRFISK